MFIFLLTLLLLTGASWAVDCGFYGSHCGDCITEPGCVYCESPLDLAICLQEGSAQANLCTATGGRLLNASHIITSAGSAPGSCNAAEDLQCPQYTRNGVSDCTGCLAHVTNDDRIPKCGFCMVGKVTGACVNILAGSGAQAAAVCELAAGGELIYEPNGQTAAACPWTGPKTVSSCPIDYSNDCEGCQLSAGCGWCRKFNAITGLVEGFCTDTSQASVDDCNILPDYDYIKASGADVCAERQVIQETTAAAGGGTTANNGNGAGTTAAGNNGNNGNGGATTAAGNNGGATQPGGNGNNGLPQYTTTGDDNGLPGNQVGNTKKTSGALSGPALSAVPLVASALVGAFFSL